MKNRNSEEDPTHFRFVSFTHSFRLSFKRKESSKKKKDKEAKEAAASAAATQSNGAPDSSGQPPSLMAMLGNSINPNLAQGSNNSLAPGSPSAGSLGPGGALPAKFIRATTVKTNTLSPYWNERFRL